MMRWRNELEGYEGPIDHGFLVLRSQQVFKELSQLQDLDKQTRRKALLEEHPDQRIRVTTEPLKKIISYESFKCSPFSSIARDQAIVGSDIDGGIVATEQSTTSDQQLAFVDCLRSQGFDVYHKRELNFVSKKVRRMEEDWWSQDNPGDLPAEIECWQFTEGCMADNLIQFATRSGINRIINSRRLILPVMIYLAGYNIE